VPGLMRRRLTLVEFAGIRGRRARHRLPVDHDAVQIGLARLGHDVREVRPAEEVARRRRVEVQRVRAA
jgi:hypothetical protein